MEKENNELSGQEPESQSGELQEVKETAKTEEGQGAPTSPETVNVLGRDYDLSKLDQVRELSKDYDRLGRMYAPLTQQLAELEKLIQEQKQQPVSQETNLQDPETVEYLKKLGFVSRDELSQKDEDKMLQDMLQGLEKAYDGKDGKPRFDSKAVLNFCVQNGISNPEHGYKIMNYDALKEWDLRQAKTAPPAPPSSGGGGAPREPQPKRRVFGPVSEGEVDLRDAMLETLEETTPKATA